jgi:hypothetical protein
MDPYRQFRREIEIDFYVLGAQDEIPDLLARGTNSLVCGPSDRFAGSAGTLKLIISTCRLPEAENVATVSQIQGSILSGPQNLAVASDQWARSVIQAALKVINYLGYSSFEMDCDLPGWFRIPVPLSEVRKGFLEGCLVKYAAQAGFSLFRMTSGLLEFKRPTEVPRLVHQYQIERCEESPRGFCRSLHEAVFARSYARGTEMRLSI